MSKISLSTFTYLNQPFFFGLISSLITSFFLPNNPFFWTGKFSSTGLDFLLNKPFLGSFLIDYFVLEIFVFLGFNFKFLGLLSANKVWYTKKPKTAKNPNACTKAVPKLSNI